jgi:hypothetical protein
VPGAFKLSEPVWGEYGVAFAVPFPEYAFAVAHASRALAASAQGLRLPPSFFLATSLKESFMGCSKRLTTWQAGMEGILYRGASSVDIDGCFQIEGTTAMLEVCRMFPNDIACSGTDPSAAAAAHEALVSSVDQDTLGRDNFVSSAVTAAYYDVWAFYMAQKNENVTGMFDWLKTAADPYAVEKVTAALYNRGAWSGTMKAVAACHDKPIEQCVDGYADYVRQVGAYTREMEAQVTADNCYDNPITAEDVEAFVRQLVPVYKEQNLAQSLAAAQAAFDSVAKGRSEVPFQEVAGAVLDAVEGTLTARIDCPAQGINTYYGTWGDTYTCPAG